MNKFIYVSEGDMLYRIKMVDFVIEKQNKGDFYSQVKVMRADLISENCLELHLDNGEIIYPLINDKVLTTITQLNGSTTHRLYSLSKKDILSKVEELFDKKVVEIESEIITLENKELDILKIIEQIKEETTITMEEFASMEL